MTKTWKKIENWRRIVGDKKAIGGNLEYLNYLLETYGNIPVLKVIELERKK